MGVLYCKSLNDTGQRLLHEEEYNAIHHVDLDGI